MKIRYLLTLVIIPLVACSFNKKEDPVKTEAQIEIEKSDSQARAYEAMKEAEYEYYLKTQQNTQYEDFPMNFFGGKGE